MKLTKTIVCGAVLSLAFVANCDFIFGPDWKYGEDELRAAVEGTWKLTRNGEAITITATQATSAQQSSRAGFIHAASACGSRSFVRSAAACGDATTMPLELVAEHHAVSDASLIVDGTEFRTGYLRFQLDGAIVGATIDPQGRVAEISTSTPDSDNKDVVTLQRLSK